MLALRLADPTTLPCTKSASRSAASATRLVNVTISGPPFGSAANLDDAKAAFKTAWEAFKAKHGSTSGAALKFSDLVRSLCIPNQFILIIPEDGLRLPCSVAWRRDFRAGVAFD
jgi:hypothetical protein